MLRYVIRMFGDQWRQWVPSIAVVAVITSMVGVCVHQFAWTGDPAFRSAIIAAGGSVTEVQILSVTIYAVIAVVAWVSLTIVGSASVQAARASHALWLLMGAAPTTVFFATLLVLTLVAVCGAAMGAAVSTVAVFWVVPAFNATMVPEAILPSFTFTAWAPIVTVILSVATALIGGFLPARHASHTTPSAALKSVAVSAEQPRTAVTIFRIIGGLLFILIAASLVVAAVFASQLDSTTPASMFNLTINAGGSALIAVYFLCPEIATFVFCVLYVLLVSCRLVVPILGVRAARNRVALNATTIAPLATGLGGIGLLLCAVNSVVALTEALQPGTRADLSDVWVIVTVVAVSMVATSAAVVALSARDRGREIALFQAMGMRSSQICSLIAAESLALTVVTTIAAAIPVVIGGLVCAFVSHAVLGSFVVVWPIVAMIIGAAISWSALFIILLVSALAPLRDGPSLQLREQGI